MRKFVTLAMALLVIASLLLPVVNPAPAEAAGENWLTGWTYRKKITIDQTKVDADLTNFPVLVKLTSSNFDFSKALSTGYDIRFTDSGGSTLLYYERERHDSTNSLAEYWVKVPSVSGTVDTDFYIYYGKADATDGADPTNVWDSNFKMVQHLKENPAGTAPQAQDSTTNNNDGTSQGTMTAGNLVDGKIGKAWDLDGTNDYVNVPHSSSIDPTSAWTLEAWIKRSITGTQDGILEKYDWASDMGNYILRVTSGNKLFTCVLSGQTSINSGTGSATLDSTTAFYYVVGTFDASTDTLTAYVNGTQDSQNTSANINPPASSLSLKIGAEGQTAGNTLNGIIDEARISDVARSAAWVKASYNSGNDSLVSYASEESEEAVPTVTTNAATSVEFTTATLNGNVTAVNGTNITERGFDWDTDTGEPYANTWTETGTFSTGTFSHGITGLSTGTTIYFRAKAKNSLNEWGYGSELTLLTKPAPPTNVAATDGTDSTKVVVTWTKSTGATGYQVYRDGIALGWLGDVATYDDTGADAPTITAGTATATDGTLSEQVALTLTGTSASNGTTHTYKVKAMNATGDSADSATDTGYRGVGALTYQWQRSAADSDASYSNISGATSTTYNDTGGVACPSGRYYKCVVSMTGATTVYTNADRGYMAIAPTVTTTACTGSGRTWAIVNGTTTASACPVTITQIGFDYGLTTSYGSSSTETGSWTAGDAFSLTLTGLSPAAVYHFRAKVYDGSWSYGADMVFSTEGGLTLYEEHNTGGDADSSNIYSTNWAYQTVTTNITTMAHTVTSIKLMLKRTGLPGTVTVSVRRTAGGVPTGSDIVTSTLNGDAFETGYTWYEFETTETSLEANTTYAIIVQASAGDASNYINWQRQATGTYTGGNAGYSTDSGSSWTSAAPADQLFEIWGNPCLEISDAKVFTGYKETGDWLITIRYINIYPPYYDTYDVRKYFTLQLLDGSSNILASVPVPVWGNKVGNIYLSADRVSGLNYGGNYSVRMYSIPDGAYYSYVLTADDWQGGDLEQLDNWVITSASIIGDYYNDLLTTYIAGRGEVLNATGGTVFTAGINGLSTVRPELFQVYTVPVDYTGESTSQTFRQSLAAYETTWGADGALMLQRVENWLGIDGGYIGGMIFIIMMLALAITAFPAGHTTAANVLSIPCLGLAVFFGLDLIWLIMLALFAAFLLFKNMFMDK